MRWTKEDLEVLELNIPCYKMAEMTGHSVKGVYSQRNKIKKMKENSQGFDIKGHPIAGMLSQQEKEARLYTIAEKIGVKVGDGKR